MSSSPTAPESAKSGPDDLAEVREAEHVQPVVDGHDDDVAGARQVGAVEDAAASPTPWKTRRRAATPSPGRLRPSPSAGVNTFSTRQSSSLGGTVRRGGGGAHRLRRGGSEGERVARAGPRRRLGRRHEAILRRPSVAPYGMPLKILMSSTTVPRTFPADVGAVTLGVSAAAERVSQGSVWMAATKRPACLTKVLRLVMCCMFALTCVGRSTRTSGSSLRPLVRRAELQLCLEAALKSCPTWCPGRRRVVRIARLTTAKRSKRMPADARGGTSVSGAPPAESAPSAPSTGTC